MKQIFSLLVIALLCSACMAPGNVKKVSEDHRHWLLSGEALADVDTQDFVIPEERVLYLNREMREYAKKAVNGYKGRRCGPIRRTSFLSVAPQRSAAFCSALTVV